MSRDFNYFLQLRKQQQNSSGIDQSTKSEKPSYTGPSWLPESQLAIQKQRIEEEENGAALIAAIESLSQKDKEKLIQKMSGQSVNSDYFYKPRTSIFI